MGTPDSGGLRCGHVPDPPRDPPELQRLRQALIHSLANNLGIITANLTALRALETRPEVIAIMEDIDVATERALRNFEALRKLA
jgi:hypothetical protein